MIKVDVDAGGGEGPSAASVSTEPPPPHRSPSATLRAGFSRFEVCESSERPGKKARLNAQLIEILAEGARRAGGQSGWEALARQLTELQEAEVRRVRKLLTSSGQTSLQTGPLQGTPHPTQTHAESRRVRAAALAELEAGSDASNALGVSASSMLLSGFDPVREPRLVELLRRLEETRLTKLKGSFKLPLVQAVNVFGQPDPTGSLPEGHVCVIVDGMELAHQMCSDGEGEGGCGLATEVLVHKSPGCHAGDVRKLKHVRTRELEALLRGVDPCRAHTIFFSTQGERAIADTIAGCDHDGDKFTVISDPLLVRLFAESPSWDAPPRGSKSATTPHTDPQALQRQLIAQVLKVRYKSSPLVGQSANNLMALTDTAGLGDARVKRLIDVYYAALDVGVTGKLLTSLPSDLCPRVWPEWMRGRSKRTDITYCPSPPSSILGRLHCSLKQVLADASAQQNAPVICDPMLHLEGSGRFRATWRSLHEQYGKQMAQVIEECAGDNDELRRRRIAALQSTYRSLLLETYEGEDCLFGPVMNPPDRLLLEVSAIYHVTYQAARGRQEAAAAAPAPSVAEHTAARTLPVMGAAGPMSQPAAASCGSNQRPSQGAHTGTGLSFVWAVAGDFLELIKCRAMQYELCTRRGEHTAPKMYMAKNMRLLLSKR